MNLNDYAAYVMYCPEEPPGKQYDVAVLRAAVAALGETPFIPTYKKPARSVLGPMDYWAASEEAKRLNHIKARVEDIENAEESGVSDDYQP